MKPNNLEHFSTLSNLSGNDYDLVVQSSRMDFESNTYINEIWKRSNNNWKQYKFGKNNFSSPTLLTTANSMLYVESMRGPSANESDRTTYLKIQTGRSSEILFETTGNITNYYVSKDEKSIFVVTSEWREDFKSIEKKNEEPMRYDSLPFRFDTRGIIYNKRGHVYKVNLKSKKSNQLINGDKEQFISIDSVVPNGNVLYFIAERYNSKGTMLDEVLAKLEKGKISELIIGGMMGNLFFYEDTLHAIGLRKRFEWPTNSTILKINEKTKNISFKYKTFDRNINNAKVLDSNLYFTYEDSGKTLLRNGTDNTDIINKNVTIKDFALSGSKLYVIANSFSNPDEVFEVSNGELVQVSLANQYFVKKVKTHEYVYKRIDTGKSKIDTWGIFVGKDKPTILNIHGGPASQYGFTFFDEFQTYASAGFNVIACNPRGSTGRGHEFLRDVCGNKWGVTDMHDVLTSFKKMVKVMGISSKEYGIMGGSYGGFMTAWVIAHNPTMFKSAIVERALLNWETMVGTSDIGIGFPEMYLLNDMSKNVNFYRKKSPITYASKIKTPTMLIHSQEDYRCPIEQAEQLFTNLKLRGVATTMLRFPGESHELSRSGSPMHRKQRFEHIIDWHKQHLS